MYLKLSYDSRFDELMMHLKSKYPEKLFDLDGIGKQTDLCQFSKDFFAVSTTADVSVDANANVTDMTAITYNTELPKPFFKLNSYYMLWKYMKRLFGHDVANATIEKQINGDIYINDAHGIASGQAYSYHPHTTIIVRDEYGMQMVTMEYLFEKYSNRVVNLPDREVIYFNDEVSVLDEHGYVNLECVLRHKTEHPLLCLETKSGYSTLVTADHPVIRKDGSEVRADELTPQDSLKVATSLPEMDVAGVVDLDWAYLIGFFLGDGFACVTGTTRSGKPRRGVITITQNNVVNTKVYGCLSKLFTKVSLTKEGNVATCYDRDDAVSWLGFGGHGSTNKRFPSDVLAWGTQGIKALLAGLIDSDGNVNRSNGMVTIRVTSFALAQQAAELFRMLGAGKVRVSFVGKYRSREKSYKSNHELYRVSVRLEDRDFINYSAKIANCEELVYKEMQKDGRFESDKLHAIREWDGNTEYVYDITTASGTFYSQGMIQHNCFNNSTYDIMLLGLPMVTKIKSVAPKYLYSFKSQIEQFVVLSANSTLGATGLADLLICVSHYVQKILDTGKDGHFTFASEDDIWNYVKETIISIIYTFGQPMRASQSCFTNVSVYDSEFLESLCPGYIFPDGSSPSIPLVEKIQELYLDCMNETMRRTPVTFPVTTACFSVDDNNTVKDKKFLEMIAKKNVEFGFINIYCGKSSTLSSCCRLRSETDNEYFNSFGAGSTKIGSLGVVTVNMPRLAFKYRGDEERFFTELEDLVGVCSRINHTKRHIVKKRIDNGNLPLYSHGFMDLSKQYSTLGVNGLNEACEIMGYDILEEAGQEFVIKTLNRINGENDKWAKRYKTAHNCEQIPGENVSVKLADKDRLLGLNTEYTMYSNQFIPLTSRADMLDRIRLQGMFDKHFSGGAICHVNVEQRIDDYTRVVDLIEAAAKMGVVYFAINYNIQRCENDHMTVGAKEQCPVCGELIVENLTRVVGFLTSVNNWNKTRREVDYPNRQWYEEIAAA